MTKSFEAFELYWLKFFRAIQFIAIICLISAIALVLLLTPQLALSKENFNQNNCLIIDFKLGKTTKQCILSNGQKREYRLYIPIGMVKNPGLIIALHGGGSSAKILENYSALNSLSDKSKQTIIVYPQAIDKHWNDGRVPLKNQQIHQSNDVQFIKDIISHVKQLNFNVTKIGIIGISNGGLMAQRLACESPHSDFTYGVVAATMSKEIKQQCSSTNKPQKIIYFFGDQDTAFLNNGQLVNPVNPKQVRGQHIGIKNSLDVWLKRNHCSAKPTQINMPDKYDKKWGKWKDDHTKVQITSWKNCTSPVVWYTIKGGGHRWSDPDIKNGLISRKVLNLGWASREFSTAEVFGDFLLNETDVE